MKRAQLTDEERDEEGVVQAGHKKHVHRAAHRQWHRSPVADELVGVPSSRSRS